LIEEFGFFQGVRYAVSPKLLSAAFVSNFKSHVKALREQEGASAFLNELKRAGATNEL
jgi:hypothetical protein